MTVKTSQSTRTRVIASQLVGRDEPTEIALNPAGPWHRLISADWAPYGRVHVTADGGFQRTLDQTDCPVYIR